MNDPNNAAAGGNSGDPGASPLTRCIRCGREDTAIPPAGPGRMWHLPEGWTGSVDRSICGNCQLAEWHPRCKCLRADYGYGDRIDGEEFRRSGSTTVTIDNVPVVIRSATDFIAVNPQECDFVDLGVSWTDDDPFPDWTCPQCGGSDFEGIHADFIAPEAALLHRGNVLDDLGE